MHLDSQYFLEQFTPSCKMLSDNEFKYLLAELGRPWKGFRKVRKGVMKRIRRHMRNLDCLSVDSYLTKLRDDPEEYKICQDCLRVTISRFFRDRHLWKTLKEAVLPDLLKLSPDKVRVWSAGCACGEEPYSLAMLGDELSFSTVMEIVATDADASCLARARAGRYGKSSLREITPEQLKRYFNKTQGRDEYTIGAQIQDRVVWQQRNLFESPPQGEFHLIFLRNSLLTYHYEPLLSQTLRQILSVLIPGGYFTVGSHEKLPAEFIELTRTKFHPCVYQKNR